MENFNLKLCEILRMDLGNAD